MTKPERLEDLGRIRERITVLLENFDDKWERHFQSKHSYEDFEKYIKENEDCLYDLHLFMRHHIEQIWEIWAISKGDEE